LRRGRLFGEDGPDDAGTFADERLLLGMRRPSIIDLAGGHPPIANEDEMIQVVCNGPRPA